ncbi:hypothetical protein D3C78_1592910 [compost metagenome]
MVDLATRAAIFVKSPMASAPKVSMADLISTAPAMNSACVVPDHISENALALAVMESIPDSSSPRASPSLRAVTTSP